MRTRNLRAILVMVVLAAMVAVGGWYAFRNSDRNLTHIGQRVTNLREPEPLRTLFTIGSHKGNKVLAGGWDEKQWHYFEIDLRSGAKTPLPNLDSALGHEPGTRLGELSPDGQWLLYHWAIDERVPIFDCAVRVDGSQLIRWKNDAGGGPSESLWSADSKGGITLKSSTGRISRWKLSDPVLRPVTTAKSSVKRVEERFIPIGPITGGYLGYIEDEPNRLRIIQLDEKGYQRTIGGLDTPRDGMCIGRGLSPNERKLFIVVRYDVEPSKNPWLRKLNTWLHKETGSFDSLWTCDINGSNLREVGHVRSKEFGILKAGWILDEDNVWLEFDGALWTVPANS